MTFKEFMKEVGYDPMTTFWEAKIEKSAGR